MNNGTSHMYLLIELAKKSINFLQLPQPVSVTKKLIFYDNCTRTGYTNVFIYLQTIISHQLITIS